MSIQKFRYFLLTVDANSVFILTCNTTVPILPSSLVRSLLLGRYLKSMENGDFWPTL